MLKKRENELSPYDLVDHSFIFILKKQKLNHVLDLITFTSSRMTRPAGRESFSVGIAFVRLAGSGVGMDAWHRAGASGECKVASLVSRSNR